MNIERIASRIPTYATAIKEMLTEVVKSLPSDLDAVQIHGIALTTAYYIKNEQLLNDVRAEGKLYLGEGDAHACKMAVAIKALRNCCSDFSEAGCSVGRMDRNLANNIVADMEVSVLDFELYSLAAATLFSLDEDAAAHAKRIIKLGLSAQAVESCVKLVSVLCAVGEVFDIESVRSYEFSARQSSM
jgi:hypothetical protein